MSHYGSFILPDTDTETEIDTETDKMCTQPNGICIVSVSEQYEHLHKILYKPFLSVSVSMSGSVNTPLRWV